MGLAACVTCHAPIPPGRSALGYAYCIEPACVKANFRPLKIIAIGVSKSIPVLTTEAASPDIAAQARRGETHDQRRATFGSRPTIAPQATVSDTRQSPRPKPTTRRQHQPLPGTPALRRLAALYISQGFTPQQASAKLLHKLTPRQIMQCTPASQRSNP